MKALRARKLGRRLVVGGVVVLVSMPLIGAGCADRMILPPEVKARVGDDVSRKVVPYVRGELEVFVTRSAGAHRAKPQAAILQCSGGNAADVARMLAARWGTRPVEICAFNYPGYGGSTGPRTLGALADAALEAFDALRRDVGDLPIFVEGFSLSTVPALHVAANRDVDGMILQNPPPLPEVIRGHFSWSNLGLIAWPVA